VGVIDTAIANCENSARERPAKMLVLFKDFKDISFGLDFALIRKYGIQSTFTKSVAPMFKIC
jgi:hypothetical protein